MFFYPYGLFDPTFLILIPAMILVTIAQVQVSSNFNRYSQVKSGTGLTGAEAARRMLDMNGLRDVEIKPVKGSLTDHYDPRTRTVNLSESVYGVDSVSAVGVACHECGHALQHAHNYFPLMLRGAIVPVANIASSFSWILVIAGILMVSMSSTGSTLGNTILELGIMAFVVVVIFHLVTLPVELNASYRAVKQISNNGFVSSENEGGVKKVLSAAALTYLGALVMAIANLLRIMLIVGGSRRD